MSSNMIMGAVWGAFGALIAVFITLMSMFALANYILSGIAYYKLAKSRKLTYPGLAWVPIVNYYLIGKISDDINDKHGEKTNRRTILLTLSILVVVLTLIVNNLTNGANITSASNITADIFSLVFSTVLLAAAIYMIVLFFIAIYSIYKEYTPENSTLYIVLSIISCFIGLQFIIPIFMLTLIKKTPLEKVSSNDTSNK